MKQFESDLCDALLVISDLADQLAGRVQADRPHHEYVEAMLSDIEQVLRQAWSLNELCQRQ